MKQAWTYLPTYAADNSAMCSALYELGGLLVMHDASGCNSTYTTHDEPRWFDRPADVFITGLVETDAILGNERRMIEDVSRAARELGSAFVAIAGTPIPMMMGCDYEGIAREIEAETGIPGIGVDTNGTDDYVAGVGKAFLKLAERFVAQPSRRRPKTLNILGVTPLDFSVNGTDRAMEAFAESAGFEVLSNWAMGQRATLGRISRAAEASVNWVVSAGGIPAALWMNERFGTPFVIGAPFGRFMAEILPERLEAAAREGLSVSLATDCRGNFPGDAPDGPGSAEVLVVGEPVTGAALRASLVKDFGFRRVAVATHLGLPRAATEPERLVLGRCDATRLEEDDFRALIPRSRMLVADPFYAHFARTLGAGTECVELPHEALSGRIWHDAMPLLVGEGFNDWFASRGTRPPLS